MPHPPGYLRSVGESHVTNASLPHSTGVLVLCFPGWLPLFASFGVAASKLVVTRIKSCSMDGLSKYHAALDTAKLAVALNLGDLLTLRRLADAAATLAHMSQLSADNGDDYDVFRETAIDIYHAVLQLSPDDGVALNNLGVAQLDGGYSFEALETLRRTTIQLPNDRTTHLNLATALMNHGGDGAGEASSHIRTGNQLKSGSETRHADLTAANTPGSPQQSEVRMSPWPMPYVSV